MKYFRSLMSINFKLLKMKYLYLQIIFLLPFLSVLVSKGQNAMGLSKELMQVIEKERCMRLMFYNCENLFDTQHDSLKNDVEFLPEGKKYWSDYRYYTKLKQIYQVITAIGGEKSPEIIGLCEVENRRALQDLVNKTHLYREGYRILHKESPDNRGIDVALLYQPQSFKPLKTEFLEVRFDEEGARPTRDILYTKGLIKGKDTLHIFINHWPSRWGGALETEGKRMFAANVVRKKVDTILQESPNAYIFITGDLNDEPQDKSVTLTLKALHNIENPKPNQLYNLSYTLQHKFNLGSHKYQGKWGILDQIIVSGSLLIDSNSVSTTIENAHIFNANFLLQDDEKYLGKQPFRTYSGYRYLGGYSDHLPVFLDLIKKE